MLILFRRTEITYYRANRGRGRGSRGTYNDSKLDGKGPEKNELY